MPASHTRPAREVLIENLGRLSEEEQQKLRGPDWGTYAARKVRSLKKARKWVYALGVTMGLFAIAVPTTAFYHYYEATERFSILGFLGLVGGACAFAAIQMGGAVYMYLNWRHELQCYRALWALDREREPASPEASAP